jgi:hypothetical protein
MRGMTQKTQVDKMTDGEKRMVDRQTNEQNCDNKTQTNTELEWHGDKDERDICRSALHIWTTNGNLTVCTVPAADSISPLIPSSL